MKTKSEQTERTNDGGAGGDDGGDDGGGRRTEVEKRAEKSHSSLILSIVRASHYFFLFPRRDSTFADLRAGNTRFDVKAAGSANANLRGSLR